MVKKSRRFLDEELPLMTLPISMGSVPSWLQGTLIRNGPSKFTTADGKTVAHWFDGLAMLHAFSFAKGHASYTNRFLRTNAYHRMVEKGRIDFDGFATDPCRSIFKRLYTAFFPNIRHLTNANINVAKFCNDYVAMTEVPLPVKFDLHTLKTLGVTEYTDKLPKANIWNSAHPHFDVHRNEVINYYIDYGPKAHYVIYRQSQEGLNRQIITKIETPKPSYMHSFALTENYVVLVEYPFVVNPMAPLLSSKGFINNFQWVPKQGTNIIVVRRDTGEILCRCQTEAFFAFHHVNAYENEQNLILDVVAYQDAAIVHSLAGYGEGNVDPHFPLSQLRRIEIDLKTSTATQHVVIDAPFELPRINELKDGRPYRYAYATDLREALKHDARGLYKIDAVNGKFKTWSEVGCLPGEPVFVALPGAHNEDEGIVLAVVINQIRKNSFLLILNAETFQEQTRLEVPHLIPMGLHGQFFCDKSYS